MRASVERLAERGTALLLTADCGIGSVVEVGAALDAGMEVIVTDHHQPGDRLPECPILHPVASNYPFHELCAAAVAFKLVAAMRAAGLDARGSVGLQAREPVAEVLLEAAPGPDAVLRHLLQLGV